MISAKPYASIAFLAALALSSTRAPAQPAPPPTGAPAPNETPWPVVLGQRTAALERDWPIVDQVVLVPDGRTYLDELAKWSPAGRWPVLIEDRFYAPMFIRAFAPARVVRRASVGSMPADRAEREKLIATSAAEAIHDGFADVVGAAAKRGITPSMVVIASADDRRAEVRRALGRARARGRPHGPPVEGARRRDRRVRGVPRHRVEVRARSRA